MIRKYLLAMTLSLCVFNSAHALDLRFGPSYWDVEDLDASVGVSAKLSEPIYKEWVDVEVGASWLTGEEGIEDDTFQLIPLDLGVRVHLTSGCRVDPYLLAGATYLAVDNDDDALPDLDGNWGGYAGAGIAIPVNDKWDLYSDVVFRFTELDNNDGGDDVDANGLQATAGVSYSFN
jgi:hypothetical protein